MKYYPTYTSCLYLAGGVITSAIVIRYIGFSGDDQTNQTSGFDKFVSMMTWYQTGICVSAATTCLLKYSGLDIYSKEYPVSALFLSILGMANLYPQLTRDENNTIQESSITSWLLFWPIPSLYFCGYDKYILSFSAQYTTALITCCLTIGVLLPLQEAIGDFGFKISQTGVTVIISGIILKILKHTILTCDYSDSIIFNTGFIILFCGMFIDDVQQVTERFQNNTSPSQNPAVSNPNRQSIQLFVETAFIFGRIAALVYELDELDSGLWK